MAHSLTQRILLTFILLVLPGNACGQAVKQQTALRLSGMFADNMVLQQQTEAPIWGVTTPGQQVTVSPSWSKVRKTTTADKDGKWMVKIQTPTAGGPHAIEVQSEEQTLQLKNVMSGEVWICSGQSNMQWKMRGFGIDHWKEEVSQANYPNIRFCQVSQVLALEVQENLNARWSICNPKSVLEFSAVGYFFGNKLRRELNVPIGLISSNWGGSTAEAWMNPNLLASEFPEFNETLESYPEWIKTHGPIHARGPQMPKGINHQKPAVLYNSMIRPMLPFAFRGVIWYQGESNVKQPEQYRRLFPGLIKNWRDEWGQGEFPFYFVQIAPFHYRTNPLPVAMLREAQLHSLSVPNTGMVVTMDIGNPENIHPKQKKPVGERLALLALTKNYDQQNLVASGPVFDSHTVVGNRIGLKFTSIGSGLKTRDGLSPSHFTIAGNDKAFVPAEASIERDTVWVTSRNVQQPIAVRYAWGNADEPNLINAEGLPCSSFRTDAWKINPISKPKRAQPRNKKSP